MLTSQELDNLTIIEDSDGAFCVAEIDTLTDLVNEIYWSIEGGEDIQHTTVLLELYHRWRVTGALPDPYRG